MSSKLSVVLIVGVAFALAMHNARTLYAAAFVDPCALLTTAEVSAVIGTPADAGKPIFTTGCQWRASASTSTTSVMVVLSNAHAFTLGKTPVRNTVKTPVSGIGDDAMSTTAGKTTSLSVKKGNNYFVVRVIGLSDPTKELAMEKTLAADVIAKL